MKPIIQTSKINIKGITVAMLLLSISLPVYSQNSSADDKEYTIGILTAILFAFAVGLLMAVSLIRQKNKEKKKMNRYIHAQRKHSKLTTYKY